MRICFKMCVCTLLNANPVMERVGAYALEGKKKTVLGPRVHVHLRYGVAAGYAAPGELLKHANRDSISAILIC